VEIHIEDPFTLAFDLLEKTQTTATVYFCPVSFKAQSFQKYI
jgi:hypothetical protein